MALSKVGAGVRQGARRRRSRRAAKRASACRSRARRNTLGHGDVVIAAITSCTNTSNPYVMLGAGLLARNAIKRGLKVKPWVKTSLAPGSQVASRLSYERSGSTSRSRSSVSTSSRTAAPPASAIPGPLPDEVSKAVNDGDLVVAAVLSGNRNFEGRVHQQVRANYLASPMLVVCYALAGKMSGDLTKEPIGYDKKKKPVYLSRDLAEPEGDRGHGAQIADAGHVPQALRRRVHGRRRRGRRSRSTTARPTSGTTARPM